MEKVLRFGRLGDIMRAESGAAGKRALENLTKRRNVLCQVLVAAAPVVAEVDSEAPEEDPVAPVDFMEARAGTDRPQWADLDTDRRQWVDLAIGRPIPGVPGRPAGPWAAAGPSV